MNDLAQMPAIGWILIFVMTYGTWLVLKRLYRGSYFYRGKRDE